jgi:hypothetical protein
MTDLTLLKQRALEATPGPWVKVHGAIRAPSQNDQGVAYDCHARDALFIAAANPQAILSLLADMEALKEKLATAGQYTEAHERLDDWHRERVAIAEARATALEENIAEAFAAAAREASAEHLSPRQVVQPIRDEPLSSTPDEYEGGPCEAPQVEREGSREENNS